MKKSFQFALLILSATAFLAVAKPKYIFLFIGDGMSTPQRMIAEEYAIATKHGDICFNHFPHHATTRTASANSLVTDSAAAATALACGVKTNNGSIGVDAQLNRVESTAEMAKKLGYKVGIVSSVTINHATPAGFYGHQGNRGQAYNLGLDLLASKFDYFGGGGLDKPNDDRCDNYQGNIYDLAAKAGYKVVNTREGLNQLSAGDLPVWARGSEGSLPYNIDSDDSQMKLHEFVEKGIELLYSPEDQEHDFFMMVEGGSIDWGGHSNDAATNLNEVLGLDQAVRVALKFYNEHPKETLIIVTGDHETGGMTMGFAATGYAIYTDRLANQKCSADRFAYILKADREKFYARHPAQENGDQEEYTFENTKPLLIKYFGFKFGLEDSEHPMKINKEELAMLEQGFANNSLHIQARIILNHKCGIGWTSGSHTALPVLTTAIGADSENFEGFLDNTDIANRLKIIMNE